MQNALRISLVLLFPLLGWQCARAPYTYQPPPTASSKGLPTEAAPQLLFLSFRFTAAPGPRRVELLRAVAVPGQLPVELPEESTPSFVTVSLLDAAGKPCGEPTRLPHPLVQSVEAPAAGSSGALVRAEALLPEAEFFVRVVRPAQARAVRIDEAGPAAPTPVSVVLPLPI